jgi:thioesterase domain-containing protein
MVAYETARLLQAQGRQVDLLILVDAPSVSFRPGVRVLLDGLRPLAGIDVPIWHWLARLEKAVTVPKAEKLPWAARGLVQLWTGDETASSEAVPQSRRAEAMARYRPKPMPVRAVYYSGDYAGRGWGLLLPDLHVVEVPGGHYGGLVEHIGLLATDLRTRLAG